MCHSLNAHSSVPRDQWASVMLFTDNKEGHSAKQQTLYSVLVHSELAIFFCKQLKRLGTFNRVHMSSWCARLSSCINALFLFPPCLIQHLQTSYVPNLQEIFFFSAKRCEPFELCAMKNFELHVARKVSVTSQSCSSQNFWIRQFLQQVVVVL